MAHLCCSIDMEPRTLNQGELNNAREEAVDIVQKMEMNEGSNIFIEGLRPVVSIKGMGQKVERRDELHTLVENKESAHVIERPCICSCASTYPEKEKLREPLSAPF
ncbi:hypothetical protein HHK36_014181 [Tetracentron sinense]|uniref:Uncharacterized protein n=1 Tax=Tetracentron sinense TaxID=13715 RepID=A0A835DE05_TETSI|nr:hypothetical protein HHK36_014181 [Tetracentron sinense]